MIDAGDFSDHPGTTRTWWHPLLARLLDHAAATAYTVREEVPVGKLPLRVDILLIAREVGTLSETSRRELGALLPLLNHFTLIQFKGPTDALQQNDLSQLLGCAFLWRSQQVELTLQTDISLIVLAPTANKAIRDELQSLGGEMGEHDRGTFRLAGLPFTTYLVETDTMADRGDPILSLVSRVFLRDRGRIIELLTRTGHGALLWYMLQQVHQFRRLGEDFAMQHKDSQYLGQVEEELVASVLASIPAEKRLQGLAPEERLQGLSPEEQEKFLSTIPAEKRLQGLAPEERLRGLPPDEVLRSLTPEEFAAGLSEEHAAQLRKLLDRRRRP